MAVFNACPTILASPSSPNLSAHSRYPCSAHTLFGWCLARYSSSFNPKSVRYTSAASSIRPCSINSAA